MVQDNNYPSMRVNEDKTIILRASAFGGCYRALVAECLGYVPDQVNEMMKSVFQSGHDREGVILSRLKNEYDIELVDGEVQKHIDWDVIPGVILSMNLDGIGIMNGEKYLVEVKTASKDNFAHFQKHQLNKPKIAKYPWQVSVYYHALKMEIPELAGILYVVQEKTGPDDGLANTDPILVFTLDPPYSVEDIESRAIILKTYYELGIKDESLPLPPCTNDNFCQFRYLHDGGFPIQDPDIAKFIELMEEEKELHIRVEEAKKIVVDRYKEDPRCDNGFESSGYKFKISKIESEKFDKDGALAELKNHDIDSKQFFSAGNVSYRLTPTKLKGI